VKPGAIRSAGDDEAPFINAGSPVRGTENGDAKKKTAEAKDWGGQAGGPYDRCYHKACDRIDNVDSDALDRRGDRAPATRGARPPAIGHLGCPAEERHCRPGGSHAEGLRSAASARQRWRAPAW
jgi:hypothetical protein